MEYIDSILLGNCLDLLQLMPAESVQVIGTSPPFYGLRQYEGSPIIWESDPSCQHQWADSGAAPTKIANYGSTETIKNPALVKSMNVGLSALSCSSQGKPTAGKKKEKDCEHKWVEHPQPAKGGINHPDNPPNVRANRQMQNMDAIRHPSDDCEHEWGEEGPGFHEGQVPQTKWKDVDAVAKGGNARSGSFCTKCGAWFGMLGLEPSPELYISHLVQIFREARRVLRKDGTFWLNIGDSYWGGKGRSGYELPHEAEERRALGETLQHAHNVPGYHDMRPSDGKHHDIKPKDLIGIPWMLALALRNDGWWLRSTIIWKKPNCLSGGTRVYVKTQKGATPMTIKDMVRLDPATVKLWNGKIWTQAVSWTENPMPDSRIKLTLRSGETLNCTCDHLWPTQRGNIKASELQTGDILSNTVLPEPESPVHPRMLPDEQIGWFIGLYLAEGSLGNNGETIQISSHSDVAEYRYQRLKVLANNFHGTCRLHFQGEKKATVNMYGKLLLGIVNTYIQGNGAKGKHLHTRCWYRSNVFLKALLRGYLNADGHFDESNQRWRLGFTRNTALANDFRTLCARLGLQLRLNPATSKFKGKEYPSYRGEIRFSKSKHLNNKLDTEIVSIGKAQKMKYWDIAVEDEPHLFALASGVLTHNCMPSSAIDRPTTDFEYIFLLAKNGAKPCFWTHRDGYGAREKPDPDYRWWDNENDTEVDTEPENWRYETFVPRRVNGIEDAWKLGRVIAPVRRWKRYNLWSGHAYYYDNDAIKEPMSPATRARDSYGYKGVFKGQFKGAPDEERWQDGRPDESGFFDENGRNKRCVWSINTKGFPGAHFAVWPEALVEPMILAGSSDKACPHCGAAWSRSVEKEQIGRTARFDSKYNETPYASNRKNQNSASLCQWSREKAVELFPDDVCKQKEYIRYIHDHGGAQQKTVGFHPTCNCDNNDGSASSVVLDPFCGAGTTCVVAKTNHRRWVGMDAAQKYVEMSQTRVAEAEPIHDPDENQLMLEL